MTTQTVLLALCDISTKTTRKVRNLRAKVRFLLDLDSVGADRRVADLDLDRAEAAKAADVADEARSRASEA